MVLFQRAKLNKQACVWLRPEKTSYNREAKDAPARAPTDPGTSQSQMLHRGNTAFPQSAKRSLQRGPVLLWCSPKGVS